MYGYTNRPNCNCGNTERDCKHNEKYPSHDDCQYEQKKCYYPDEWIEDQDDHCDWPRKENTDCDRNGYRCHDKNNRARDCDDNGRDYGHINKDDGCKTNNGCCFCNLFRNFRRR